MIELGQQVWTSSSDSQVHENIARVFVLPIEITNWEVCFMNLLAPPLFGRSCHLAID